MSNIGRSGWILPDNAESGKHTNVNVNITTPLVSTAVRQLTSDHVQMGIKVDTI